MLRASERNPDRTGVKISILHEGEVSGLKIGAQRNVGEPGSA
jgi:hypothetical protein